MIDNDYQISKYIKYHSLSLMIWKVLEFGQLCVAFEVVSPPHGA
jgi:hypothetical protein